MSASFLWNAIPLICRFIFRQPCLHPGVYIGFELYVVISVIAGLWIPLSWSNFKREGPYRPQQCDGNYAQYSFTCRPYYRETRNLALLAYAFGFLIW